MRQPAAPKKPIKRQTSTRERLGFDPKKSILSLPVFWLLSGLVVLVSIVSASLIIANSELSFDFSYKGFNNAILIFKFPLGFLATLIPLIALMNANHRSEQTKAQILYTESQATFSNYYKHIEEFEKYIDTHLENRVSISSKRDLHYKLYPNARQGDFNIDDEVKEKLFHNVSRSFHHLYPPKTHTIKKIQETLTFISKELNPIFTYFGIQIVTPTQPAEKIYSDFLRLKIKIHAVKTILKYDQGKDFYYMELLSEINISQLRKINDDNKQVKIDFFNIEKLHPEIRRLMTERALKNRKKPKVGSEDLGHP
jgi:hypothetical protein